MIDFSQIVVSSAVQYHSMTKTAINDDLLRHIALNSILTYKKKFRVNNQDIYICCDGSNYWRKGIFPEYKQNRKKAHEKDKFDWDNFYKSFDLIREEYRTELPFHYLHVDRCEADDIIAVLCKLLSPTYDIIIVSGDKDFIQIQESCPSVKQFSHKTKKFLSLDESDYDLFDHVFRGDTGDGIPNVLTDDKVFITEGVRSKPLTKKQLDKWKERYTLDTFGNSTEIPSIKRRFERNRRLIDFSQIPEEIQQAINQAYKDLPPYQKREIYKFLVKHKLRKILEKGEFN